MYIDAAHCYPLSGTICRSVTLVSTAKTDEVIEIAFALRTRVGSRHRVLDRGQDPPWE